MKTATVVFTAALTSVWWAAATLNLSRNETNSLFALAAIGTLAFIVVSLMKDSE